MDSVPQAETSSTAPKRARLECLIHCSLEDHDSILLSPKNIESWNTLITAAKIRQHAPILDIAKDLPDGVIPQVTYHSKCRSNFTMKRELDTIAEKQKSLEEEGTASETMRKSARQAPCQYRVYEAKCNFVVNKVISI